MSLLKQLEDRGAVMEWSPISSQANMIAVGTKDSAGAGFDDYGGELELHVLDLANTDSMSTVPRGSVKASSRFSSLAWSEMTALSKEFPLGLLAGGMVDGNIHVWDPAKLAADDPASLLLTAEQHQGPIPGLQFNPHKEWSHSLASGGNDGELFVMSLERPDAPVSYPGPETPKHVGGITKVAWNTATHHILATATGSGSTYVWDMKQRKAWCEIRDPLGGPISDIAWSPDQGLNLITASGDDRNPVLKVWDLRQSTSLPLATLTGHSEGILSVSWCPTDTSLLLSCGKDNRTILWDLFRLKPVYELPTGGDAGSHQHSSDVFGGLASAAGSRRYDVSWSPCLPAVISTCSFDRKVQFYSMTGARSNIGRAPKWLRKQCGAAFGFGGKLVTFTHSPSSAAAGAKKSFKVKISQVVEDPELSAACDAFHQAISTGDYKTFCDLKSQSADNLNEKQVWGLMKVICFESNAREQLRTHLGFDSVIIADEAAKYLQSKGVPLNGDGPSSSTTAADLFSSESFPPAPPASLATPSLSPEASRATAEMVASAVAGEAAEPTIRNAVVVGNFEAAVDCCLEAGLMAEALLLAQCGDQPLWLKTQAAFFERQKQRYGFLSILHAIIKNELMEYVLQSDLSKWQQTLAVLSTYGKSDEFPAMCEALATRLEKEMRDGPSSTLCYMCAANVARTVEFWTAELKQANAQAGQMNTRALQQYIEKVMVFTNAHPGSDLGTECSVFFAEYAGLLAAQGRMDVAGNYLKGNKPAETILLDRLYHSGTKPAGSRPPAFPFPKVTVHPSVAKAVGAAATTHPSLSKPTPAVQATQAHQGAHASQPYQQALVPTTVQELAPGWTQLLDSTSQRHYYVNQATGQSQWEAPMISVSKVVHQPVATPAPIPTPTPTPMVSMQQQMGQMGMGAQAYGMQQPAQQPMMQQHSMQQPMMQQPIQQPMMHQHSMQQPMMQQPAQQHMMQQPVQPSTMPSGFTANAASAAPAPAPASSASSFTAVVDSAPVDALGLILNNIAALATPAEKKQIPMVQAAYQNLLEKVAGNQVSAEVMQRIAQMVDDINARNFVSANAVQTDLVNTAWNAHKDWIKGVKILIQLAQKK